MRFEVDSDFIQMRKPFSHVIIILIILFRGSMKCSKMDFKITSTEIGSNLKKSFFMLR